MNSLPYAEEPNSFGYWLRRRRKSLDWTQADLARRVNCTAAMIRKIEADERKPSRPLAEALAVQLKIPVDQRAAFLQSARRTVMSDDVSVESSTAIPSHPPNNLPAPLTSLVDRVHDIATVAAVLTRDDVRLLTLIGPPGIGKTRLCLQSADNVLVHFPDGVWFVDLAPLGDSSLVLPTIARALNIAESGAIPPSQQLHATFKDKRVLLALDNFEQVTDAARGVSELLKACKNLKVLATSRVPLHIYGEHEYAVPSMSLPPRDVPPNKLTEYEAVQLFIARVREHQPKFAITFENAPHVTDVCIRLDGVPLALELAAASLRRMEIEQLVLALRGESNWLQSLHSPARDLPARQQTLYNAIAWSYTLLDATTQSIFRQLGILVSGFDAEAATAICQQGANQIESALTTLTDHNLLARAPARWQMLEMIREFALEQMLAGERASVGQRHALYFADRLQEASADALEHDHDNYRAALRWAIRQRNGLLAVTMCGKLSEFWETRGYLREGLVLAREVLAIAENVEPRLRIGLLNSAGHLAWNRHEFDAALKLADQAIDLARASGLEERLAGVFNMLARIFIEHGDYMRAEQTLHDCVQLSRKIHDADNLARATTQLGEVALACGKLDDAQASSEQALALLGNRIERFTAMARTNLAEIALARGNHTLARDELQRAVPYIHSHTRRLLCFLATLAGWLITSPHTQQDDARRGVELFGAVAGLTERTGAPPSAMYYALNETRAEIAQQTLTQREWHEAWETGKNWTLEQMASKAKTWLK